MASTPSTGNRSAGDRHPAQWLALAIGVVYLAVGVGGFAVTGFDGWLEPDGELLLGIFEVNPLHNVVHIVIGLLGVALWTTLPLTAVYGWILALGYGLTWVYGLFVANTDDPANFLALNEADNWLHLVSALAGAAIVAWTWKETRGGTASPDRPTDTRRTR